MEFPWGQLRIQAPRRTQPTKGDVSGEQREAKVLLVLSGPDLDHILEMRQAIRCVEQAYAEHSAGRTVMPLRLPVQTERGTTLLMPAYVRASTATSVKVVSVYEDNPRHGLPTVLGVLLLLDADTGRPLALMDAARLTAIRTGASGGVAAKYLARRDSSVVALFGAGVQARTQLLALSVLFDLEEVRVYDVRRAQSERLVEEMTRRIGGNIRWVIAPDPEETVRGADIVVCATTSREPVFSGDWLTPGMHVTGVGSFTPTMREIDEITLRRASRVVVDSYDACWAEAGDLIRPVEEGLLDREVVYGEIGEIVLGRKLGRRQDDEITVFKAVGLAVLDTAVAAFAYRLAREQGLGVEVAL